MTASLCRGSDARDEVFVETATPCSVVCEASELCGCIRLICYGRACVGTALMGTATRGRNFARSGVDASLEHCSLSVIRLDAMESVDGPRRRIGRLCTGNLAGRGTRICACGSSAIRDRRVRCACRRRHTGWNSRNNCVGSCYRNRLW